MRKPLLPHLGPRSSTKSYAICTERLYVVHKFGTKFTYARSKMFQAWMMATNLFIMIAAVIGTAVSVFSAKCCCPFCKPPQRAVLIRSDATVADSLGSVVTSAA